MKTINTIITEIVSAYIAYDFFSSECSVLDVYECFGNNIMRSLCVHTKERILSPAFH